MKELGQNGAERSRVQGAPRPAAPGGEAKIETCQDLLFRTPSPGYDKPSKH